MGGTMQAKQIAALLVCMLLMACAGATDTASGALDTAGNETSSSYTKMREMMGLQAKKAPRPVDSIQPRYCYKTYEDIVCYGKPVPGYEERLVAYQNKHGGTGYTLDPMPVTDDNPPLPTLKAVDVPTPTPAASDAEKSQLKEIIFDPAELEPKELVPDKQE